MTYFSYHMIMFVNYVEGIQEENSRLVRIYPLLSFILTPINLVHKSFLSHLMIVGILSFMMQHFLFYNIFNNIPFSRQDQPHKLVNYTCHNHLLINLLYALHTFLFNPVHILTIIKQHSMLTVLNCNVYPPHLLYQQYCKKFI